MSGSFKQETGETPLKYRKKKEQSIKKQRPREVVVFTPFALAVANATSAKGALYLSCDKVILLNMNW
ncbi:hypothetical protein JG559_11220 [Enterococcus faecalis]|uniref:Uncharacterized protein n=1 Tax=Enterococcus faecalis TaxID=1351 RepID=A0A974NZ39_ENTFL|nr:hypothetical protein JG559_11220 [Enterococcus faecalis]